MLSGNPHKLCDIICFQQHHEGVTTGHNRMTEWMEAYAEAHNPHESADSRIVYLIIT